MPAQSPTLSPTLSAMTAGLRGSSSGIPASTLPTRSAPDVSGLGEDAAAQSREDGDQRATEAEADQCVNGLLVGLVGEDQNAEVARDAQQGEADDQQAGDRAALEGDVEGRRHAAAGRLGDPGVRADRHVHADEPGRARQGATDHEADAGGHVLEQRDQDRERDGHDGNDQVLAVQVCLGALLDGAGDLLHSLVSGRLRQQALGDQRAVQHGGAGAYQRDQDTVIGQELGQVVSPP